MSIAASLELFKDTLYSADTTNFSSQTDIDGQKIDCYFYNYSPTLLNASYSSGTTSTIRNYHLGDIVYNTSSGEAYRFTYSSSAFSWVWTIVATVIKGLYDATESLGSLDSRREIFIGTPQRPDNIEDL